MAIGMAHKVSTSVGQEDGVSKRFKYRIASLLDRSPRYCWASLVCKAEFDNRDSTWRECKVDWTCRSDLDRNGVCYCGKFRNGEMRKDGEA